MSREPTKPLVIEKPQRTLTLNAEEVRHLADAVKNDDYTRGRHSDADAYSEIARKALLLLGGAYVELIDEMGQLRDYSVELSIDEEICWLFRSKVSSQTMSLDGFTNIGIALLRKLYSLLASFQVELDVGILVIDDATPALNDVRQRMEEFNAEYARTHPSPDESADADAIPVHTAESGSGLPDRPGQTVPGSAETHHEGDVTVPPLTHEHLWSNIQDPDPANYLGTGYITACVICRERRTDWS